MRPKKLHMKNGGVNFRDTSPWVFFTLLILHKWYQIITSNLNKKNTNLKQLTKNLQWEFIVTWSCIFVIIEKNQVLFLTCSALNLRIFLTSFEQVVSLQNQVYNQLYGEQFFQSSLLKMEAQRKLFTNPLFEKRNLMPSLVFGCQYFIFWISWIGFQKNKKLHFYQ